MLLKIHIQPGAKKNEVAGTYGDAVKIKIKAAPVEGRANEELIKFLAKTLSVKRSDIVIRSGLSSRQKILEINCPETIIKERLGMTKALIRR